MIKGEVMKYIQKILLVFCVLAICLCGCTKKQQENNQAYIKEFEALTEIKDNQKNIYLINKVLDNHYWNVIRDCMAKEAKEQGCNLYYSSSEFEAEWESQVELLNQAVEQGADVIIIAPDNSSMLSEPIRKVREKGIPVILIDTTITSDAYDICYMTDNLMAGKLAAQEMLDKLHKQGYKDDEVVEVAIQVGSTSSQTISERLAGFSLYWSNYAPESWSILDDICVNNSDIEYGEQYTEDMLKKYPNLHAMFGCNNGSTVALANTIKKNERKDMVLVGFDYSEEMAGMIADPDYTASTILQRQDKMAKGSIETALKLLKNETVSAKFVDTGVAIVNPDTINEEDIKEVLELN